MADRSFARTLIVAAAIAVLGWAATQRLTWRTWAGMNPGAGAIAALADAVRRGEAPGAARSDALLGTLYTPPFPLLIAGLRAVGAGWQHALRLGSVLAALLLLVAVAVCARRLGRSAAACAAACGLVAASFPFQSASLAARADLPAAAFTLLAVAAWAGDPQARRPWIAIACALAWLTKLSACAVPLAVVVTLAGQGRGKAAVGFALRVLLALAVGIALMAPVHGPAWYRDVVATLLFAPRHTTIALRGAAELLRYVASFGELLGLAVLAIAALRERDDAAAVLRPPLIAALAIALVVLADRQSDHNHLIELVALAAVAAAGLLDRARAEGAGPMRALAAGLAALAMVAATWRGVDGARRLAQSPTASRAAVLERIRATPGEVLTEDALLSLAADRRPVFVDPAVVRSLALRGDPRADRLIADLRRGRWALVVLNADPEFDPRWYRDFHLGAAALDALRARYVAEGTLDDFTLERPRE